MSINQHYHGTPVIIPPAPAALVIADYLRYYQYRVSDTSYRPYVSVAEANASVNVVVRPGRVVLIGNTEYWWKDSTSDNGLIKKGSGIRTVNTVGPDASGNVNLPVTAATATNLSVTTSATQVSVESSTGKNAVLLAADNSNAGLLLPAEKAIIAATSGANTGDQDISGIAANATAISAQTTRLNTLVTGAPPALDTLPKIAAQLASDESGVAAILATQQQHTQQIALKADLVNGIVPVSQIPYGLLGLHSMASGQLQYFSNYAAAHAASAEGDTILFGPGNFGDTLTDVLAQKGLNIVLDPGTVWNFKRLYLHTGNQNTVRKINISGQGSGKLVGTVGWYGGVQLDVQLNNLRHDGNIFHNAYLGGYPGYAQRLRLNQVRAVLVNGQDANGNVINDYITAFTRKTGYYYTALAAEIIGSTIDTPQGAVFSNTGSGGNLSDAQQNLLKIYFSTLHSGAAVISQPDGVTTFDFSQVAYTGTLPANIVNGTTYNFTGLPSGGGAATQPPTALTPTTGTVTLDFAANPRRTLAATGNLSFVTSNRSTAGAEKTVYVTNTTGSDITLTYEAWVVMMNGTPLPVKLAARKELILTLTCLGTSVSDVKAAAVLSN